MQKVAPDRTYFAPGAVGITVPHLGYNPVINNLFCKKRHDLCNLLFHNPYFGTPYVFLSCFERTFMVTSISNNSSIGGMKMQLSDQEKLIIKILRLEPDTKEAVLNLIESFGYCDGSQGLPCDMQ